MRKNDILWKGMLEEVFDDLLRFLFPGADELYDMQKGFEFLDKELSEMFPEPEKKSDTRYVDKLVKVFRRDGGESWLLLHIEVQGYKDPRFAKRMFTYYYRILDRYNHPVVAIAIFTGQDSRNMPDRYEVQDQGTELMYKFNTLCITDYEDDVLAESDNPFALVLLAAKTALLKGKIPELELKDQKLLIAKLLLGKGIFPKKKIDAILTFLNNYVLFDDLQTNRIFTEQFDQITGKTNTMGIIEQLADIKEKAALAKGEEKAKLVRTEEQEKFVKFLLANTEFSVNKIAELVGVSVSFVEEVKKDLP